MLRFLWRPIMSAIRRTNGAVKSATADKGPPNGDAVSTSADSRNAPSSSSSATRSAVLETAPSAITAAVMLGLIFGGCCSNVYALEAIINFEPASGTLLTFVQFLFVATTGYIAQFDRTRPPFFLTPNKVPLRRWIVNIVLFFAINVLNNHAFSYDISVPVHIILRSGGSITTMAAGYLAGKRYSRVQAVAVILLTLGVILAAWSDSQAKGTQEDSSRPAFSTGLVILFVAQILSSIMGLYTEATYREYGPQWKENLFYSHFLSLPLFIPFAPSMARTFKHLASSPQLDIPVVLAPLVPETVHVPSQLAYLVTNVLTQYACIRGVNLLAAASTALTVTIVLNIRKLVSLLLSIWLFGNSLAAGVIVGAMVVFGSGALYSVGTRPATRTEEAPPQEKGKKEG